MSSIATFVLIVVVLFAGTGTAGAQRTKTQPMSGADIFKWYCAACHGKNGKGNGPAASDLKVPPPDLTTLAKRNNGKFPADYVNRVLTSGIREAHGSSQMPVWGPLFSELNAKGRVTVDLRDVVRYLESLQER